MSRTISIVLILILSASALLTIQPAPATSAASVLEPLVPQFTVAYVDHSYNTPVESYTSTDAFTGRETTKYTGGDYVYNKTIDISIQNQHYIPINFGNGTVVNLYYYIEMKGHYASGTSRTTADGAYTQRVLASTSEDTVVSLVVGSQNDILMGEADVYVPEGGVEDVRIQAEVGYLVPDYGGHIIPVPLSYDFISFGGSDYSETKTVTVQNGFLLPPVLGLSSQVVTIIFVAAAATVAVVLGVVLAVVFLLTPKRRQKP